MATVNNGSRRVIQIRRVLLSPWPQTSEPTNFQEKSNPSCIDLFLCDQPNLLIESGTLDPFCKHQTTFCNLNYLIPAAPSFQRKIWQYGKVNKELLQRTIAELPRYIKL